VALTCRHARALHCTLHSPSLAVMARLGNGAGTQKSGGRPSLRRSSPCVVLMPQVGCHRWCLRGYGCCARCAAVRQGLRSLPGPRCVRAGLAVVVIGVRLARRPCGSVLVPPGSAAGAAGAAPDACRPGWHSPSSDLAWPGSCRSWDITSPRRLAGMDITSVPLLTKGGWGRNDTHWVQPGAISRCNQILTICSEYWAHAA